MLIDCETCTARGSAAACSGCLVALLDQPDRPAGLTPAEQRAIEVFARAGFDVEVIEEPATAPVRLASRARRRRVA
ncbi:hypothetical protein O7627_23455 [Solwaraspora sp. WMMD1047]|uniref:hypothetical protein n=1 Tax=Solwaraspora sp. WMMD1047 TaxID=3016102 RepID=UPI0024175DCD|nr:hypothetical protein [Solwaraspora sp. WMMD1047]MDG4832243.1 hypothetical protein [Solwaraspora sp. WMMD1047]